MRAGEIVGLAGLVGAGRTEVARVLFGIDRRDGGEVRVDGRPSTSRLRRARHAAGLAYLPEDRHQEGLVLDYSIAENVTLPILPRCSPAPRRRPRRARSPAGTRSGSTSG